MRLQASGPGPGTKSASFCLSNGDAHPYARPYGYHPYARRYGYHPYYRRY